MTGAFWARSIDGPDYLLGSLALKPFGTYWGPNLPPDEVLAVMPRSEWRLALES